ncbi:MAG: hypothetical protein ABSA21_04150 [Candidatus Limnocylindrales bacterium]|jgi:hypothetical protein
MVEILAAAALLLAGGLVVFVVSIRVGILLGQRLDRALEARAVAGGSEPSEEVRTDE